MNHKLIYYYLILFFLLPFAYFCYKTLSLKKLEKIGIYNTNLKDVVAGDFYYLKLIFSCLYSLFLNPIILLSELHKDRILITNYNKLWGKNKLNIYIYLQTIYLYLLFIPLTKNFYLTILISFLYSVSFLGFYINFLEGLLKMFFFEIWSWILFLFILFKYII